MNLSSVLDNRSSVSVTFDTEELTVSYRPAGVTPKLRAAMKEAIEAEDPLTLCRFLAQVLISWDLLDEKGRPYPVTEKALIELPDRICNDVAFAIFEDMRPNPKSSEPSAST